MITTVLCYSAILGSSVADYGKPCRVDMGNVGLFGDGAGGITYKVAMRGACWLHEKESERRAAFNTIKKLYDYRSKIVHGNKGEDLTDQRVNELEGMVRSALRKFLTLRAQHGKTPCGRDIDDLIMAGKV